jgi:hypothetical protein
MHGLQLRPTLVTATVRKENKQRKFQNETKNKTGKDAERPLWYKKQPPQTQRELNSSTSIYPHPHAQRTSQKKQMKMMENKTRSR